MFQRSQMNMSWLVQLRSRGRTRYKPILGLMVTHSNDSNTRCKWMVYSLLLICLNVTYCKSNSSFRKSKCTCIKSYYFIIACDVCNRTEIKQAVNANGAEIENGRMSSFFPYKTLSARIKLLRIYANYKIIFIILLSVPPRRYVMTLFYDVLLWHYQKIHRHCLCCVPPYKSSQ